MLGGIRFLPLQLAALAKQQDAPTFEVLLCDNGENQSLIDAAIHPHIRVVDASQTRGATFARNCGIAAARAEHLLFCDADDAVGPNWVRDGFAALQRVDAFSGGAVPMPREIHGMDVKMVWRLFNARLPQYTHVAVAYRVRPSAEVTVRRSFRAGYRHATVCALHAAWELSPSFAGNWVLRPLRTVVNDSRASRQSIDALARLCGLAVGRLRYSVGPARAPKFRRMLRLGADIDPTDPPQTNIAA